MPHTSPVVRALLAIASVFLLAQSPAVAGGPATSEGYTADGRAPLSELYRLYQSLSQDHGWQQEVVYAYPEDPALQIRAWHTPRRGKAVWIIAGIHGEEPAGPNAIAHNLAAIVRLADAGVPVVVIPLCNPKAYRNNWRYPNTAERDWRTGGGYSVGDAEYLLPDLEHGDRPRAAAAAGPETQALTQLALRLSEQYPPALVLDLHEDELSTAGGYIYSQGTHPDDNPVGAEVIRLLRASGIPIRLSGRTRFDEPIKDGIISRDDKGAPIRDGSIDELLASPVVLVGGELRPGPSASTVIVAETPAFAGSKFALRVAAQAAVVQNVQRLWRLSTTID